MLHLCKYFLGLTQNVSVNYIDIQKHFTQFKLVLVGEPSGSNSKASFCVTFSNKELKPTLYRFDYKCRLAISILL